MPDKTDASINEMQLLSQNRSALDLSQGLFNDQTLVNPEQQAKILVAKIHKRNNQSLFFDQSMQKLQINGQISGQISGQIEEKKQG